MEDRIKPQYRGRGAAYVFVSPKTFESAQVNCFYSPYNDLKTMYQILLNTNSAWRLLKAFHETNELAASTIRNLICETPLSDREILEKIEREIL